MRRRAATMGKERKLTEERDSDAPKDLISLADPHIVSENSRQQGRTPSSAPGTSSIHKIPVRRTDEKHRQWNYGP